MTTRKSGDVARKSGVRRPKDRDRACISSSGVIAVQWQSTDVREARRLAAWLVRAAEWVSQEQERKLAEEGKG